MPNNSLDAAKTASAQDTVTKLADINVADMDINRIIAHVFANNEQLQPLRDKAAGIQTTIEADGRAMIEAMATQANAVKKGILAEHENKLAMQEAVLARQSQLGFDVVNPNSDRIAKLAEWIAEESNAARASTERIQQLDSVNFAANPLQWLINQFKIDSEKDTLTTATKARDSYLNEMGALHNLAQENVQTITTSKLAKTAAELQATLDKQAADAATAAIEHRIKHGSTNLNAIGMIYNMSADEHSVWFKAAQLKADQSNRERDARQDELRYKMLELQFNEALKNRDDKAALVADMRKHAVENLGASEKAVTAAPDDAILNNKSVKESYFSTFGIGRPAGPMTALNAIESQNNHENYLLKLTPATWIRGKLVDMHPPAELLKRPKEEQDKWYDEQLILAAQAELAGDADMSLLTRIPSVWELKSLANDGVRPLKNNALIKYIANAPDQTARYSLKQIVGFALKDEKYKTDGNARAKLINDIVRFTQVSVNYNATNNLHEKFGLPKIHASNIGYKIAPKELLDAHNASLPEAVKKRYFDMTKVSDVQAFVNLVVGQPEEFYKKPLGQGNFGNILRQPDSFSPSGAKKSDSKDKKKEK